MKLLDTVSSSPSCVPSLDPDGVTPPRRKFLRQAGVLLLGGLLSPAAFAGEEWNHERSIWLQRAQTGEEVKTVYWVDGQLTDGYNKACVLLRDLNFRRPVYMDPMLLDTIAAGQGWLKYYGHDRPFLATSGHRYQATNDRTEGAARNSEHMKAKAADGSIPGIPTDYLARLAIYLQGGGVGMYLARHFVHIDSGPKRVWAG